MEEHNQISTLILKGIKREGAVHYCPAPSIAVISQAFSGTADRLTQRADMQEKETTAVMNEEPVESGRLGMGGQWGAQMYQNPKLS